MEKWPENRIAIFCGKCDSVTPPITCKVANCVGCGVEVWVSPNTEPRLKQFMKGHPEVTGYDCLCADCAAEIFKGMKKEDVSVISNPNLQTPEWN